MATEEFHALVVDDNPIARTTVARALERQDFQCTSARDGQDALNRLQSQRFDLVVTDLRMPNKNGHTLAVELLSRPRRPVIAVHTAVTNPRLKQDLLARGVDCIAFKPTDLQRFAVDMKQLVRDRTLHCADDRPYSRDGSAAIDHPDVSLDLPVQRINGSEYEQRLAALSQLLPLSAVASDVYELSRNTATTRTELICSVLRDAALTAEILRLANSVFYLRASVATAEIEEAVARLGFRRVGEIALTLHASSYLRSQALPWLDADLIQQRCLAASIAINCISEANPTTPVGDELTLCALLAPLDRLIMGMAFQSEYRKLLEVCDQKAYLLSDLEPQIFPEDPTTALSRLVSRWGLSDQIWRPLRHAGESFEKISQLEDPLRTKVELLKLSILLAESAVGRWLYWENVPSVPEHVLHKYELHFPSTIIESTRLKLQRMNSLPPHSAVHRPPNDNHTRTFRSREEDTAYTEPEV